MGTEECSSPNPGPALIFLAQSEGSVEGEPLHHRWLCAEGKAGVGALCRKALRLPDLTNKEELMSDLGFIPDMDKPVLCCFPRKAVAQPASPAPHRPMLFGLD